LAFPKKLHQRIKRRKAKTEYDETFKKREWEVFFGGRLPRKEAHERKYEGKRTLTSFNYG
jgi:hypothetical protein